MAVGTGVFRAPTGQTYSPARDIERGFDKTTNIITGAIEANQKYKTEQEEAFGQLYSNLGEIEGVLQEEYNGLNQQAVDATREFMKQHYQKGGRSSDPDFQATLGQMTGRIKAGISNADNIREQIDMQAKELANNPYMDYEGKNKAMTEMFQMARNPDVLISKNPIDFSSITQKYVNPDLVFKESYQRIPGLGEVENQFSNERGDLMSRKVAINELVNSTAPFDEQGRINLNLTPEKASELLGSNPMLASATERIRKERYPNEPYNIGMTKALRDGYSGVAGLGQSTRVVKSAGDIEKERVQMANQKTLTDLAITRELRLNGKEKEADEVQDRYGKFVSAISSGNAGYFGKYNDPKAGVVDVQVGDKYQAQRDLADKISTKEKWDKMTPAQRETIINDLEVLEKVPSGYFGIGLDTKSNEAYSAAKSAIDGILVDKPKGMTNLTYRVKRGMKDGQPVYEDFELPLLNQQDMEYAFGVMDGLRKGDKGEINTTTETQKPTGFSGVPKGGF